MIDITPIKLAEELFNIHHHAEDLAEENPEQVVYKELEVIALLKKFGFPEPDFDGFKLEVEWELLTGPWETVTESLQALNMGIGDLAEAFGTTTEDVETAIQDNVPITIQMAEKLHKALKIPTAYWVGREAVYRAKLYALNEKTPGENPGSQSSRLPYEM